MVGKEHITLTFFAHLCARHLELQQPHLVLELGESIFKPSLLPNGCFLPYGSSRRQRTRLGTT